MIRGPGPLQKEAVKLALASELHRQTMHENTRLYIEARDLRAMLRKVTHERDQLLRAIEQQEPKLEQYDRLQEFMKAMQAEGILT